MSHSLKIMNADSVREWLLSHPEEAEILFNEMKLRSKNSISMVKSGSMPLNVNEHENELMYRISKYSDAENSLYSRIAQLSLYFSQSERFSMFFYDKKEGKVYSTSHDFNLKLNAGVADRRQSSITVSKISRISRKEPFKTAIKGTFFEKVLKRMGPLQQDVTQDQGLASALDMGTSFTSLNCTGFPLCDNFSKVVGVVCVINRREADKLVPLTVADEIVVTELLDVMAHGLSNSILYEALKSKEAHATELAEHNDQLYKKANFEARKNGIMLDLASSMFSEDDIRQLGQKIVSYARDLLNADKASVFMLNEDTKELVSAVFDTNIKNQFVIPASKGLAGYVATHGKPLNLQDAYKDPRFNPEMDVKTGYKTKSILCFPIPGPNRIVGVVNLINKMASDNSVTTFSSEDEEVFHTFSVLCGLALHKALLLDEIKKKQLQLEINMDLMSYHAIAQMDDVKSFLGKMPQRVPIEEILKPDYDCHIYESSDDMLCVLVFEMFEHLQFLSNFKISREMCMQYIMTIRKNYRKVAYHNFTHAVSVTHCFFQMHQVAGVCEIFDQLQTFAMFLAALNHDIDHRGTNNQFQKSAHTALANYYSTSTMERHHFNHAVNILRSPGHNMFHSLSNEDYKKCLMLLERSILATDLGLYFANKGKLKAALDSKTLDYSNSIEHLELVRGIIMTCADLNAMAKPWESSRRTADAVYAEFFSQGDEEQRLGLPISANLMDRNNMHEIPSMQVGFMNGIVIPAFELLHGVLPKAQPLLNAARANQARWKELLDNHTKYQIGTSSH